MKISIIGTGYVGLITGVGYASKGHDVVCVDIDKNKIEQINKGISPIYEENLDSLLKEVLKKENFKVTTSLKEAVDNSEITFICVGTPPKSTGEVDLSFVKKASEQLGSLLKSKNSYHTIVVKSTVVPKTTEEVVIPLLEKSSGKKAGTDFGVCMVPEFLREGKALEDFFKPDRAVIGSLDKKSAEKLRAFNFRDVPVVETDLKTAELIKYASNAFLATKISFANEIGNYCKKLGIDSYKVAEALGLDPRIAPHFLRSGLGFGGSCLPKDTKALISAAKNQDENLSLVETAVKVNEKQVGKMVSLAEKKAKSFKGKTIAVLGTAFKGGTDDIRESQAIKVISELLKQGAKIQAYDPKALESTKEAFGDKISYAASVESALKNADLCLICTEWPEFKNIDFSAMKFKVVIDGRHILESREGIDYEGLCW